MKIAVKVKLFKLYGYAEFYKWVTRQICWILLVFALAHALNKIIISDVIHHLKGLEAGSNLRFPDFLICGHELV